ncbi:MAG: hypothetical protein RL227_1615 [Pseudomonadota bacterium]|jgi:hypothetical protein
MGRSKLGTIDRVLCIVAGLVQMARILSGTVGLVPLATAALGRCPLYAVPGSSSSPVMSAGQAPASPTRQKRSATHERGANTRSARGTAPRVQKTDV